MKRILLAFMAFAMLAGQNAAAQGKYGADSAECIKYLSYYKEYYKSGNIEEAIPNWRQAFKLCPPTANQTMLIDGTSIIRKLIQKNASNAEYRKALADTLMTLHDLRAENYPKYTVTALNNKGQDIANFVKDPQVIFTEYGKIFDANKEQSKTILYPIYLNAAIELFKAEKIGADEVISGYQKCLALLENAPVKSDDEKAQNAKIKTDLESLFITSKVASCENLIQLFTPRFEAAPEDVELATNIVKMLSLTEGCADNDLYLKAVTLMHQKEPSYNSAYFLYKLNAAKGNKDVAIKMLEEAISYPESDSEKDAEYTFELATYCFKNGMNAKAYNLALSVDALDKDKDLTGKAYMLIGTIWGSTPGSGDEISKRAPFWVAVDYMNKAKAADPSLTEDANRVIAQYSKYFPQTAEAFMYDVTDGKPYTVTAGGMKATTTVRTQK